MQFYKQNPKSSMFLIVMKVNVGCKIEHGKEGGWMKTTQPVMLQIL
jgi:hypothetical protein